MLSDFRNSLQGSRVVFLCCTFECMIRTTVEHNPKSTETTPARRNPPEISWNELFEGKSYIRKSDIRPLALQLNANETTKLPAVFMHREIVIDNEEIRDVLRQLSRCIVPSFLIGSQVNMSHGDCKLPWEDIDGRIPSQEALCEHALISHAARSADWMFINRVLFQYGNLEIVEDENLMKLVQDSLRNLCDHRVLSIFELLSGLDTEEIHSILEVGNYVRLVSWDVPMLGWVTPDGICLNVLKMSALQNTHIFPLMVLIGHETSHFLCRLNPGNFSNATH
jgi:hypothetical protein